MKDIRKGTNVYSTEKYKKTIIIRTHSSIIPQKRRIFILNLRKE